MKMLTAIFLFFSKLTWWHWVLIFLGILLIILFTYLLMRPFFVKRRLQEERNNNAKKQQEDLQAWRDIAGMASGQAESSTVKQLLSSKLKTIEALFIQGMEMLKKSGRIHAGIPWFIMLGEPKSGKSELLDKSDLSLKCSANESNEEESLPIRFWLGRALVLDVSGHVFFDRWFNGSSAEWEAIRKLLLKKHFSVPLNGIILTIPADALIADSEELTKRKVALIAAELNSFIAGLGMYLPCYVVVTKLDLVAGFQEYFSSFNAKQYEKIWGWLNPSNKGIFNSDSFVEYWNELKEKLFSGTLPLLLQTSKSEKRMDTASGVYMFPDEFSGIQHNLMIYLNNLFGRRSWMEGDYAKLAGVYFTAAKCGRTTLSSDFAAIQKKPVEEAVLVSKKNVPQHAFFIRSLLENLIFQNNKSYDFTKRGRFRRNIWKYMLCILMAVFTFILAFAAWKYDGVIEASFTSKTDFYEKTTGFLTDGVIGQSPLLDASSDNQFKAAFYKKPLVKHDNVNRVRFFDISQQMPERRGLIPWEFRLSQFLLFGDFNCNQKEQDYIAARIQMMMVFKPTIQLLLRHLMTPKAASEPFNMEKREVYCQLRGLQDYLPGESRKVPKQPLKTAPYIRYLLPISNSEMIAMSDWRRGETSFEDRNDVADLFYRVEFQNASRELSRQFLEAWLNLRIYPTGEYSLLRLILQSADAIQVNNIKLHRIAVKALNTKNPEKLHSQFLHLREEQRHLISTITQYLSYYNLATVLHHEEAQAGNMFFKRRYDTIHDVFARYEAQMKADFNLIREDGLSNVHAIAPAFKRAPGVEREGKDLLDGIQQEVKRHFIIEKETLIKTYAKLENEMFFSPAIPHQEKTDSPDTAFVGQVMTELLNLAGAQWDLPYVPMKSPAEFTARYKKIQKIRADAKKKFDEYSARYISNKLIASHIRDCRTFMRIQNACIQNRLLKDLFTFYPGSGDQFFNKLTALAKADSETIGMKPELAKESFGSITIQTAFVPQSAEMYVSPIAYLLTLAKAKHDFTEAQMMNIRKISQILNTYLELYIRYWGDFTDQIPVSYSSWNDFRKASRIRKAYQTNTLLLESYVHCRNFVQNVPDILLSETVSAQKKAILTRLGSRIQIMSPTFAQSCTNVCNAWGALPESADKAFGILHTLPQKRLRSEYLMLYDTGAKGDIPWWSKWVKNGVYLLFRDAKTQLYKEFAYYRPILFSFPLCRKSPYAVIPDDNELKAVSGYLAALGCPVPSMTTEKKNGEKNANTQKASAETEKLYAEQEALEQLFGWEPEYLLAWNIWGTKMQVILDALMNHVKPLTYTLVIPSEAEQKNLTARMKEPLPLAYYRFPYVRASNQPDNGKKLLHHLDGAAVPELLSGEISDDCLELEFRSFSDQKKAEVTVFYDGKWAPLHLYLSDNSSLDPKTKAIYSAVILQDKSGKKYVFWIGFKFNKHIPLPDEWPNAQNCPEFSNFQMDIKKNYAAKIDWDQQIQKMPAGENGYSALSKLIRLHSVNAFPNYQIIPDAKTDIALFQTPYLEVATPSKKTRIYVYNPKQKITLDLNAHRLEIRLFRYSDSLVPAYTALIKGPYALLHLLTMPGRNYQKDHFTVPVEMFAPDGINHFILNLHIRKK